MLIIQVRRHATTILLLLAVWVTVAGQLTRERWNQARFDDAGSESTEKAVLTAIGLAVALGLGAAITAVVAKYQAQIH